MGPEELGLLVDAVQDYAIILLTREGEIRYYNRGAELLMGYTPEEIDGQSFSIFYGPEALAERKPQSELETAAREGRVEDEGWRVRKDGTRFWANTVITALRNDDGSVRAFAKVTRDLTERRAAEQRLRESEEIFRLLVASVMDYAIFLLDPEGRIATWNAGARRMKGYEADEIIGKHFSTFYPEEDVRAGKPARELKIARAEGSVEDEGWRVRKDGSMFWANVIITAVHDEQGRLRGFAKVTRDVTEKKRAAEMQRALLEQREARLQAEEERHRAEHSYRVAQEANRAKDEFLMTLSHELRTPMTAILGWSRLLPTISPSDENYRDAVASIARSAMLQARLIDDVLDVSRIVSGKLRLNVENVEIAPLIHAAIGAVRTSADAKSITIRAELDPGIGDIVADPTRLQQIVWNLLTNAVKFTPRGGTVTITAQRTSSQLQIRITDTGEGIEPHFLPHVFEPFRQAEKPSTRTHGGLGLGLSIVRYMAEAHGGTVSVESPGRGKGSTFTVTLPIAAVAAHRTDAAEAPVAAPQASRPLQGVQALIVDDDQEARTLLRAILLQAGANVVSVASAPLALSELTTYHPDLIISDIAMPQMDGFSLAREIRQRPDLDHVKLIALSAFPPRSTADTEPAFDEYLTKPIDPAALVDAIVRIRSVA